MSSFYFKAVAADGKLRTGSLSGESDKAVARELRKQGLTPVYVGVEQKKSFELKLPDFTRGRHRDILFFTQGLSTLLNAGVPLDRALSITSELTERPNFLALILDVFRVLTRAKSLAERLPATVMLVLIAIAFRAYIRTPGGQMWWDSLLLKVPLLGDAVRKAETARFARAMSTLVANSVPLVQSIGISAAILNNKKMSGSLESVSQGVKRGECIASPIRRSGAFPSLAGPLMTVG